MQAVKIKSCFHLKNIFMRVSNASTKATSSHIKSWKEIPGPSSLPVIGQLHHFLPGGTLYNLTGFKLWDKIYNTYGPIMKLKMIFKPDVLVLMDADSMAQVYHGENNIPNRSGLPSMEYYKKEYNKRKDQAEKFSALVTENGEKWKQFRSKINPVLMQPNVLKLYSNDINEVAQDMIGRLRTLRDDNHVINGQFDYEMKLWALETTSVIALGDRVNCLGPNLPVNSIATRLIRATDELIESAEALDYKPSMWRYYSTPAFKKAMKAYEVFEIITKEIIDAQVEKLKKSTKKSDEEKSVLEKLLDIDEEVALVTARDLIAGGIDTVRLTDADNNRSHFITSHCWAQVSHTIIKEEQSSVYTRCSIAGWWTSNAFDVSSRTSNVMTGVLYLLATHPEQQQKLREEVISKQGKSFLMACIKEALRLLPPAAFNLRITTRDYTLLNYYIPKGTHVMFCHLYTSLMESNYPRPHEFLPERWVVEQGHALHYGNAKPFAYAPFGFGVRTCIGRRIVDLETELFLTKIIENFQIGWTGPPPTVVHSLIHHIQGPFGFIFKDA